MCQASIYRLKYSESIVDIPENKDKKTISANFWRCCFLRIKSLWERTDGMEKPHAVLGAGSGQLRFPQQHF